MKMSWMTAAVLATTLAAPTVSFAQQPDRGPGQGPVASECKDDIAKFCAGKAHEGREVRTCLEGKKAEVSAACRKALETTGGGQGRRS